MKKETNSPDFFLTRTTQVTMGTGLVAALVAAARWGWAAGAGFALALVWGVGNFVLLGAILKAATDPAGPRKDRLAVLVPLKIVGLYGVGLWVLFRGWFPLPALLAGFGWLFVVLVLRAAGQMWWWREQGRTS